MLPEDFIDTTETVFCGNERNSFLKVFPYPSKILANKTVAKIQCKKYCGAKKNCSGCNLDCKNTCRWIAHINCTNRPKSEKRIGMELSIKPGNT